MFQQYKNVSQEYEKGELFKAMLLSRAQRLLVLTSTLLMSLSFVQYHVSDWSFSWALIGQLLTSILPTLFLAMIIEIALILGAAIIRKNKKTILGWVTLSISTIFSIMGGELFFNKLAEHQPLEIHAAFALIGLIVPVLQITFELNKDNVKEFLKEAADISEVRNHILEKQTESMIVETRFDARSKSIEKAEVKQQIEVHSDRTVVDLVSNQEGQETIIAEVETITREDMLDQAVDILRQERDQDIQDLKNTVQELLQERQDIQDLKTLMAILVQERSQDQDQERQSKNEQKLLQEPRTTNRDQEREQERPPIKNGQERKSKNENKPVQDQSKIVSIQPFLGKERSQDLIAFLKTFSRHDLEHLVSAQGKQDRVKIAEQYTCVQETVKKRAQVLMQERKEI